MASVQRCHGVGKAPLPASAVVGSLLFSLTLQKGQHFILNSLIFLVFFFFLKSIKYKKDKSKFMCILG